MNTTSQKLPKSTPWGVPDSITELAEGIVSVSTSSHGGYWISDARLTEMPEKYRRCIYLEDKPNWFEEDCAWAAVPLTWPQYFSLEIVNRAQKTYDFATAKGWIK